MWNRVRRAHRTAVVATASSVCAAAGRAQRRSVPVWSWWRSTFGVNRDGRPVGDLAVAELKLTVDGRPREIQTCNSFASRQTV